MSEGIAGVKFVHKEIFAINLWRMYKRVTESVRIEECAEEWAPN